MTAHVCHTFREREGERAQLFFQGIGTKAYRTLLQFRKPCCWFIV